MFGDLMGGRRGGAAARGADLRYNMELSLEDAFRGKTAQIRVPSTATCEACRGSGAEGGAQTVTCQPCHEIGSAGCRERVCPSGDIPGVPGAFKKKNTHD